MNALARYRWSGAIFVALTALALNGCKPTTAPMTPEEQRRMAPILSKLTTRCVGRYLIDLPSDFVLNPVSKTLIEGVTIEVKPMKRQEFDSALALRKLQIENGKFPLPYLTEIRPVPNAEGLIFNRAEGASGVALRVWELLGWRDGFSYSFTINAYEKSLSASPRADRPSDLEEKFAHLLSVFERTRGRADDEVPAEPGVCFANGFVRGAATDKEDLTISYDMSGLPKGQEDGGFTIYSMSNIGPEGSTLLQRGPDIEANLRRVGGATLRSGTRSGQGLDFEEWLLRRPNERKVVMYDFTLEFNSQSGNAESPLVIVDFGSGMGVARGPQTLDESASRKPIVKAIFNEAESIALWDASTPTLRKRPNAF